MVVVFWIAWVAMAYFVSQFAVSAVLYILPVDISADNTLVLMLLEALTYVTMLLIGVSGIKVFKNRTKLPDIKKILGCDRPVRAQDALSGFGGLAVYYAVLIAVMLPLALMLPDIIGQEQSLGFNQNANSWWELILIFVALVLVAPMAEELLMRGLLFGRIRDKLPFWPTALIISVIFAVAHWQVNVAIDTFILSMVMCYAREKTGTIYSSVLIHMIKNGLAYTLLFIA